ncbi:26S proteasome subunit ECM29 [Acrasis kona]|uniref:26S proteasome subunit ECM29 n=1 Tax=Acrasis kona TaxID=1008807 RepID=A0AAW2YSL9_9EUKA
MLLTDSNEITNEVAGRGLAYVYQMSDENAQSSLVDSLVDQLSGSEQRMTKTDIKITEDSNLVLFPDSVKEVKGKSAGSGTYKELVDVANDIGRPEMIYQMLAVSSHNAIWNAKRAAAFSAVSIVQSTNGANNDRLVKMLPQIAPKLYRYTFDPNPVINKAMTDMWKAIVKNPKQTIDEYLVPIAKELLSGANSNLWRVREASCYALTDLYNGRKYKEMEPFIEESLLKVFRVMDDVKDSPRKAAATCLRKLATFTEKCCDPKYTDHSDVPSALNLIMGVYLKQGLLFPLKDVVYISLAQIQKISVASGPYLRPHIAEIVGTLIELTSVLEPQMLSYVEQHTGTYGISKEELENLRMSMNRSGPIADTLSQCERQIDESVLVTLVPKLMDLLRSGVGHGTRLATARFVQQLSKFHGVLIRKHTQQMLRGIMNAILNSSGGSSSGERAILASSLPYVLKNSKMSQADKVLTQVLDMYVQESADENSRYISALLFEQMIRQAPIIVQKFYEKILPVAFVARHDPDEKVKKTWNENVWDEVVAHSSTKDFTRLFIGCISEKCLQLLQHSSWQMKKQGGLALGEIGSEIPDDIPDDITIKIIKGLEQGLFGRTWDGKHVLLDALGDVLSSVKKPILENCNETLVLMIKECRKTNLEYRLHGLMSLKKVLNNPFFNSCLSVDTTNQIVELTDLICNELTQDDDMQIDQDDKQQDGQVALKKKKDKEQVSVHLIELQPLRYNHSNQETVQKQEMDVRNWLLSKLKQRTTQLENIAVLRSFGKMNELKPLDKEVVDEVLLNSDAGERQVHVREAALVLLGKVVEKGVVGIDKQELKNNLIALRDREKDKNMLDRISSVVSQLK